MMNFQWVQREVDRDENDGITHLDSNKTYEKKSLIRDIEIKRGDKVKPKGVSRVNHRVQSDGRKSKSHFITK